MPEKFQIMSRRWFLCLFVFGFFCWPQKNYARKIFQIMSLEGFFKWCQKIFSDHVKKGFSNDPRKIFQIMSRRVFQIMPERFLRSCQEGVFKLCQKHFLDQVKKGFSNHAREIFSDHVKKGFSNDPRKIFQIMSKKGFSNHARKIFQVMWRIIKQACQISWHHVHDGADPWVLSCVRSCLFCNLWVFFNVQRLCFWFVFFNGLLLIRPSEIALQICPTFLQLSQYTTWRLISCSSSSSNS